MGWHDTLRHWFRAAPLPVQEDRAYQRALSLRQLQTEISGNTSYILTALGGQEGFYRYTPDTLASRKGLRIYDKMLEDDQIKAALALKTHAVMATGWHIEPADGTPDSAEPAALVTYAFEKMEGNLQEDILEVLSALTFGFSISELVFATYDDGPFKGKVGLRKLATRRPHDFEFVPDAYDNLLDDGIKHGPNRYPRGKFAIFSNMPTFNNHYGTSDLRAAYRHWWAKDNTLKFWAIWAERFGVGTAAARFTSGVPPASVEELKKILKNLQAPTSIVVPDGVTFETPFNAAGAGWQAFRAAIDHYDLAIARSILLPAQSGFTAEPGAGSFAKAKAQFNAFLLVVEKLRQDLQETVLGEQVIRPLIDLNYEVDNYPKFRFNAFTEEDTAQLLAAFVNAVSAGVVGKTPEDEIHVRSVLGFPERELEEIKAERV